jgi:hypothetical protein
MNRILFELNRPNFRKLKNFLKYFYYEFTNKILQRPIGFVTVQGPWRNGYEKISKHIKEINVEPRPNVTNRAKIPLPTPFNHFSNFSERWVVKLTDVVYNSTFGVAIANNHVILDTLRFPRVYSFLLSKSNRRLVKTARFGITSNEIAKECTPLDPGDSVIYGHFILYGLPRILRANSLYPDCKTVLVSQICADYIRAFLIEIGFEVIEVKTFTRCLNLIVAMDTFMSDVIVYPRDVELIKKTAKGLILSESKTVNVVKELIYIPRVKEKRALNVDQEDSLIDSLSKIGFNAINYKKLNLISQIDYFRQAKIVVSQTGSGLANMVFLPHNSLVVELGTPNELITTEIPMLADLLGIKHIYVELSQSYLEIDRNLINLSQLIDDIKRNYLNNYKLPWKYFWNDTELKFEFN